MATSEYMEEIKSLPVKRQVSVSGMLKKIGVSRSGYDAWKKRVPSDTSVRRVVLKEKIQKVYEDSHQNYGAPKITAELQIKEGEQTTNVKATYTVKVHVDENGKMVIIQNPTLAPTIKTSDYESKTAENDNSIDADTTEDATAFLNRFACYYITKN